MFICTLKANNIKFFAILFAAAALLVTIVLLSTTSAIETTAAIAEANSKISYEKIKTNEDRIAFLEQFGWSTTGEVVEEVTMKIPAEFDKVMNSYNEIQKNQGLDLSKYRSKEVTRYTYEITNYPDYDGKVYANLIICKNRVVGGDVCSADVTGFIRGFAMPDQKAE